jgi:hypothetical protein
MPAEPRLLEFWQRFARSERRIGNAVILENPHLPMLEVNAAHTEEALEHSILLSPASLEPVGFKLEGELVVIEARSSPVNTIWVEQVPWSRANALAVVWCEQNNADDWIGEVPSELARVLQRHPDLLAFLALEANRVTGMMIVSSAGFCGLSAGTDDAMRALISRGNADFTGFRIALERSRLERISEAVVLERYIVWVSSENVMTLA